MSSYDSENSKDAESRKGAEPRREQQSLFDALKFEPGAASASTEFDDESKGRGRGKPKTGAAGAKLTAQSPDLAAAIEKETAPKSAATNPRSVSQLENSMQRWSERSPAKRKLAPMLQQYVDLKERYPEHLLLFQVGDFYEVFFDDAKIAADVLDIRLTSRDKDQENPIPMCGVPQHALDNYLPKLLKDGLSCVVMSQVEEGAKSKNKKGGVRREITRIVTPGVRYEGDGLDERKFNYLAAVCMSSGDIGVVSYVDVSTGHLRAQEAESTEEILEILQRITPSEILIPSQLFEVPVQSNEVWLRAVKQFADEIAARLVTRPFERVSRGEVQSRIAELLTSENPSTALETLPPVGLAALATTLNYVEDVSFTSTPRLSKFTVDLGQQSVLIDTATRRNLELSETRMTGDRKNSLIYHIDYCKTAMGARQLSEWIHAPSSNIEEIIARHDAVEELAGDDVRLEDLRRLLVGVRDLDRLVSRVTAGRATPSDLGMLTGSLASLPEVVELLESCKSDLLAGLTQACDQLTDVYQRLSEALVEQPPVRLNEGGIFGDGFHEEIDRLRDIRSDGRSWLTRLENSEKEKTGITALKIKYNNVFGYFIEVTKTHLAKVPAHYERKQTLANAERYVTQELKEQEVAILSAKSKQVELERELFVELRAFIASQAGRIQQTSSVLSQLDVLGSFAHLSRQHNYVRPLMREDQEVRIERGRHPVVEQVLGAHNFVPNDCQMNGQERRFAVLTGPNMGGKSTYLRQVGLMQLLAQAGSFVPAASAELGVVDRIFTRIGAADDLSRGDSTFMVEMREAAVIVRKATSRSLVLIDEVGRGTATSDGLAIALAVAEWLHDHIGCRTIFATHFHQLTELERMKDGAFCLSVGVVEREKDIVFTHRIEERAADRSYGIEVARLAGLPEALLARAVEVLTAFSDVSEESGMGVSRAAKPTTAPAANTDRSVDRMSQGAREILDRLRTSRPDTMTPLQALTELSELKEMLD